MPACDDENYNIKAAPVNNAVIFIGALPCTCSLGQCGAEAGRLSCCLGDWCAASLISRWARARWENGATVSELLRQLIQPECAVEWRRKTKVERNNPPGRGDGVLPEPHHLHYVHIVYPLWGGTRAVIAWLNGTWYLLKKKTTKKKEPKKQKRTFLHFTLAGNADPERLVDLQAAFTSSSSSSSWAAATAAEESNQKHWVYWGARCATWWKCWSLRVWRRPEELMATSLTVQPEMEKNRIDVLFWSLKKDKAIKEITRKW